MPYSALDMTLVEPKWLREATEATSPTVFNLGGLLSA